MARFEDVVDFAKDNGLTTDIRSVAAILSKKFPDRAKNMDWDFDDLSPKEQKFLTEAWKKEFKEQNPKGDSELAWKLGVEDIKNTKDAGDYIKEEPSMDGVYTQQMLAEEQRKADEQRRQQEQAQKQQEEQQRQQQAQRDSNEERLRPAMNATVGSGGVGFTNVDANAVSVARAEANRLGISFQEPPNQTAITSLKEQVAERINSIDAPGFSDKKVSVTNTGLGSIVDKTVGGITYLLGDNRYQISQADYETLQKEQIERVNQSIDDRVNSTNITYNQLNSILLDPNRSDQDKKNAYQQYYENSFKPTAQANANGLQQEVSSFEINSYDSKDEKTRKLLFTVKSREEPVPVSADVFGAAATNTVVASNDRVEGQQFASVREQYQNLDIKGGAGNYNLGNLEKQNLPQVGGGGQIQMG